jgi:dihydrofolate reductase
MGRLITSIAMTVDGVIDVGDWYVSEGAHDRAGFEQFENTEALVMGRKTYEGLAGYWAPLEGMWADWINPLPKYVASRTASEPLEWNATLIEGDAVAGVSRLKEELEGDLFLVGCGAFARKLVVNNLIDDYRFWIHPNVQGAGGRPFESGETLRLQLVESKSFDSGVTLLRYEPAVGG